MSSASSTATLTSVGTHTVNGTPTSKAPYSAVTTEPDDAVEMMLTLIHDVRQQSRKGLVRRKCLGVGVTRDHGEHDHGSRSCAWQAESDPACDRRQEAEHDQKTSGKQHPEQGVA